MNLENTKVLFQLKFCNSCSYNTGKHSCYIKCKDPVPDFLCFYFLKGKKMIRKSIVILPKYCFFLILTNRRCLWGAQGSELLPYWVEKQYFLVLQDMIPKLSIAAQLWPESLLHANAAFVLLCLLGQTVLRLWYQILKLNV